MLKTCTLFLLLYFCVPRSVISQCLTAPPVPACLGTEPLALDNETINQGSTKWYYGSTTTFNSLYLNGGTLIVCGNLTIDKFYMDSGTIYVRPGGRLLIGSGIGFGLVLKGNAAIYNYGTFEIQRNLSLEGGYASASKPNIVMNITPASVFRMPNQYFVINNPFSYFINNGSAEFWGIITETQSLAGCVCLGNGSSTRMAVLINKIANTYNVPTGTACLNVYQYSQFYGQLTDDNGLLACLGSSHNSDAGCIPWGCQPNNWGAAQVFTGCAGCNSIMALSLRFTSFNAVAAGPVNKLQWQLNTESRESQFVIERSSDGTRFQRIDSLEVTDEATHFEFTDNYPLQGNNYYMIRYFNPRSGMTFKSKMLKVYSAPSTGFHIYPVPFVDNLIVRYGPGDLPEKIIVTDMAGRNIRTKTSFHANSGEIRVDIPDPMEAGVYILHIRTKDKVFARTILKN